ncbi:MAG: Gfo/Idh/MocA family oxidoreductase [Anaerolineae bacterium]|jgi:predicted dehydrogenase|nr:Gfo/Idh/MocA family oxidoreductase [Anaerolineae bacterium]
MIRAAIVGCGGMGGMHADCLRKLADQGRKVKIVAAVDIVFEKAEALASQHPGAKAYLSLEEMLDTEQPDLVYITTPSYLHSEMAVACFEAECHVFSEKPMALDPVDALAMGNAADLSERFLMVGQVVRFWDSYRYLQQAVKNQRFGKLLSLRLWRSSQSPSWGERSWFLDEELSGRAPVDIHIHDTDFVHALLGKPEAVTSHLLDDGKETSYIYSHFQYPEVEVYVEGGWVKAPLPFNYGFEAIFAEAVLHNHNDDLIVYETGKDPQTVDVTAEIFDQVYANLPTMGPYVAEDAYFLDCIENNTPPSIVTPDSAMASLNIVFKEVQSARLKKPVRV